MYFCLCNALSDAQIGQAVLNGASHPRDVYATCGCRAQCGGCTKTVLGIIRNTVSAHHGAQTSQEQQEEPHAR